MLPPIEPAVLEQNPSFAILYEDLCTRKLNPDGSSRDAKRQRVHDEIRRNLNTSLTHHHTTQILLSTLTDLPSRSDASVLPPELHSVIELTVAQLSGHLSASDRNILAGDNEVFLDNIDVIAQAVSEQLERVVTLLCTIADPSATNPPPPSSLPTLATTHISTSTSTLPTALSAARIQLANTLSALLHLHTQVLETGIRILEQTIHGALSRNARAKAEVLGVMGREIGVRASIHNLTHPTPPALLTALQGYKSALRGMENGLKDRIELAEQELGLYEKAGEKGMKDLARRAKHLRAEIRRVEDEIRGLEEGK
ncbi:hypothetical protein M011DRAFT_472826 [Sporormia fimetaria CBS 119925]|uniref:HAUS augmin-like complex subunit 4 n=1 Tax=Sporormia fimetaria CBS 119925 TaxID=1340428 RepID=A0A6A6UV93_9PLEO|nr:hypothetical protein M011DRAFT_472826 [Sporormia fimetaria CBS 119925]